jgi:hypothetical protein
MIVFADFQTELLALTQQKYFRSSVGFPNLSFFTPIFPGIKLRVRSLETVDIE